MQTSIRTKRPKIPDHRKESISVPLSSLDSISFNPPGRTTDAALSSMAIDIGENGVLAEIHIIPRSKEKFVVVDGHRRVAISRRQGRTHLRAVVHHLTEAHAIALWQSLNTSKSVTAYEWMHVWYHTEGKGYYPSVTMANINACLRLFGGRAGIKKLLDGKLSPTVGRLIQSVLTSFLRCPSLTSPDACSLLDWVVEHRGQGLLQSLVSFGANGGIPANVLRKLEVRVRKNQPMTLAEAINEKQRGGGRKKE